MNVFYIVTCVLLFVFSVAGAWCATMFTPGTYLIYAQTFASGAFLGIAFLHFLPETIADFRAFDPDMSYPWYSIIIAVVFACLCIMEMKASTQIEDFHSRSIDIAGPVKDFSVFLIHRFTAITSTWMRCAVYAFLALHAFAIGFAVTTSDTDRIEITLALAIIIEKFVESFTISLIAKKGQRSNTLFWTLIVLYSLITPGSITLFSYLNLHVVPIVNAIAAAISSGLFLLIGILLWRKTFLTSFDWQKKELVVVCVVFVVSIAIQAVTGIDY